MKRNILIAAIAATLISSFAQAKPPAPVPVIAKAGKYNVYGLDSGGDLDALKYVGTNKVVYNTDELTKILPIIDPKDIKADGLTCEYICVDKAQHVVGRVRVYADGKK